MLTYRQPLRAVDAYDKVIYTNQSQAVIWAIGPVNKKVSPDFILKKNSVWIYH